MFATRAFPSIFNSCLADHVDITVVGQDFILQVTTKPRQSFHDEVYGRLTAVMKPDTLRVEVLRDIGDRESAWAAVKSLATATTEYGE